MIMFDRYLDNYYKRRLSQKQIAELESVPVETFRGFLKEGGQLVC